MGEPTSTVVIVIAAVSAIGAVGAAIGAFWSANATRKATEAQLLLSFLAEYNRPEMARALRLLRLWKADYGDGFEGEWRQRMNAAEPAAQEVDESRRKVKGYFFHALRLHQAEYVSDTFFTSVAAVDGVNILYDIVEPLERALNPTYDQASFKSIREIVGRARSGRLLRPIPVKGKSG